MNKPTATSLFVVLDGPASPEVEFPEEYALRLNTTYYPGNPEPTIQVLNHAAEPMQVQGLLSDRLMGTQNYARQTRELLRTGDDGRKEGDGFVCGTGVPRVRRRVELRAFDRVIVGLVPFQR